MGFCQHCEQFFPTSNDGLLNQWKAHVLYRCNNGLLKLIIKTGDKGTKDCFELDNNFRVINTLPELSGLPLQAICIDMKGKDLRKLDYDEYLAKRGKIAKDTKLEFTFQLKDSKIDYVNQTMKV